MGLITREQDYILRVMKALHEGTGWMNAEDISTIENMPKSEVFKMVRVLRAKDLIESKSGQGGGYKLRVDLKQIKVLECIKLLDLEIPIAGTENKSKLETQEHKGSMVYTNLDNLQKELQQRLSLISVYDLIYINIQERRREILRQQAV